MNISHLVTGFQETPQKIAIVWNENEFSYSDLNKKYIELNQKFSTIPDSSVVAIEADFSPTAVATLLCLIQKKCIIVPLTKSVEKKKSEFRETAQIELSIVINDDESIEIVNYSCQVNHDLLLSLKKEKHPGLILFSSGTTGKSKAALHDFEFLLEKFKLKKQTKTMIGFLLFDHIGGINTLLYCLSNNGTLVTIKDRRPEIICDNIQKYKIQILPTSPTFLNLLLLSKAYEKYDLSSLETITYGTEPMPESTLIKLAEIFKNANLQQTYGLSEIGILRSKSESNKSLWVKVGGEGYETRIVDGLLEVKAKSAMKGYLNAPSPFTEDGWFKTGDMVEQKGDYIRILGRKSDIINVGGEKVYPIEVESVLLEMPNVSEVIINGEPHPIVGNVVKAIFLLHSPEELPAFRSRMRKFLTEKGFPSYKIPQKIIISEKELFNARFKKLRDIE